MSVAQTVFSTQQKSTRPLLNKATQQSSDTVVDASSGSSTPSDSPSPPGVKETDKLNQLLRDTADILFTASSVFPFDFFPAHISVEKTKVNIVQMLFFGSNEIRSLLIQDIAHVEVDTTLFFATLRIISRLPSEPPIIIHFLRKKDAVQIQQIIQGLMVGIQEQVDMSQVPSSQLLQRVKVLGKARAIT